MAKRLPPEIGVNVEQPFLYNPYIDGTDSQHPGFLKAAMARYAPCCQKIGFCGADGLFRCPACGRTNSRAPRVFRRMGLFVGRRGGKSVAGARAVRNEIRVPDTLHWVCGPTNEILHDATMPTLLKIIPRDWCADWNESSKELLLKNRTKVQFRSLHDPDRGHAGVGLHSVWLDEAAFIDELAWDYLSPALTDFGGVAFFTSSVDGFDWTYKRIEKPALVEKKPGFWVAKYRTIDNPYIATYRMAEVEEARATMPPKIFRQEYEGERETFTGAIYGELMEGAWLTDDQAVMEYIPEWPAIHTHRRTLIGLDSGIDHPFGAVKLVVTEKGIIAVAEYLERQQAFSLAKQQICQRFQPHGEVLWAANQNEAAMRMEFQAHGILVAPAENDQKAGTQRVASWLFTKQLKFAYTCPQTFEQMKQLRWAPGTLSSGEKTAKERVYKKDDELPDCVRYALMTWPSLPTPDVVDTSKRDLRGLDARTRWEIETMQRFMHKADERDLEPADREYPTGDFYHAYVDDESNVFAGGGW